MKKDNLIFIHKLLKAVADSIIKVFIPLYILKVSDDLMLAMHYLVIYSSFTLILMASLRRLIQKHGVLCILLHFVFIIASNGVLTFAPINIYSVISVAFLMAFSQAFYSIPLNLIFTFGDKNSNVAKFQIPSNIGKLLFTLGSGLLLGSAVKNSFLILSITSSVFYLLCALPLLFVYKDLKKQYAIYRESPEKKPKLDPLFVVFHILFGLFQPIMDNVVPLFLYVNNLSFQAVTIMIVLVELFKVLINILSQFLVRKGQQLTCVIIGFVLALVSIVCLVVIKSPVLLYIFSTAYSVSFPLTFVPMFRMYCQQLRKTNNIFSGMVRRDLEIFSFRPLLYCSSFIGFGLIPVFVIGIAVLPAMFVFEIRLIRKYPATKSLEEKALETQK